MAPPYSKKNIRMYFKYKFKAGTPKEKQEEIYALWDKTNDYFKNTCKAHPKTIMELAFLKTDDGWEAWETFPDAAAYERHADNTMKCPFMGEMMAGMEHWEEVDSWIMGPEDEIAKSPKIAEFYPTQKRIFQVNNLRGEHMHLGYKNMRDGDDDTKQCGNMVFEYEYDYVSEEAKPKAIEILNKMSKATQEIGSYGTALYMLKFSEIKDGKGYKVVEIVRSPALYDSHCEKLYAHPVAAEAGELMNLIKETSSVAYGLKADLNASTYLPQVYPDIKRVHGSPILAAWGPSRYGWVK